MINDNNGNNIELILNPFSLLIASELLTFLVICQRRLYRDFRRAAMSDDSPWTR